MKQIRNAIAALVVTAIMTGAAPVYAVTTPNFPICTNPQGQVISSFEDGVHGIVGSTATYTGSDRVYAVAEGQIAQCFCSSDGVGIQTNWWNASSLTEDQINDLKAAGWYYVANGNVWGLDSDPYVAQNTNYSCLPSQNGGGGGTGGPGDGRSDGRSSCPECTQAPRIGGGDILGLASEGEILGLASTGDAVKILAVFLYASVFFFLGYKLSGKKHSHRQ